MNSTISPAATISLTFPDGATREFPAGMTGAELSHEETKALAAANWWSIAEVTLTGEFAYGVEFAFTSGEFSGGTLGNLGLPDGGLALNWVGNLTDQVRNIAEVTTAEFKTVWIVGVLARNGSRELVGDTLFERLNGLGVVVVLARCVVVGCHLASSRFFSKASLP